MNALNPHFESDPADGLRFIWLELTNRCNLACVHCYADSGPHPEREDVLDTDDFRRLLDEAAEIGCRAVQFIGGEPTVHRGLPDLIAHASSRGFEYVEVYTNGTRLPPALLDCFVRHDVSVAVSIYADDPDIHDAVTARPGSHRRTIANLRAMVDAGLQLRVGVISMEANRDRAAETLAFIQGLGVERVTVDEARAVGRGGDVACGETGLQALCGVCWRGSLCIAPDGGVSPCVMSKAWPVGSTLSASLGEIVQSAELRATRTLIRDEVWAPLQGQSEVPPTTPCIPNCTPPDCPPILICPPSDPGKCPPIKIGASARAVSLSA